MITSQILARATAATRRTAITSAFIRHNSTSVYGDADQTKGSGGAKETGTGSGDKAETGGNEKAETETSYSNGNGKPQPRINDQRQPGGDGDEEVARHNREMDQRYGKRKPDGDDRVGGNYWKGMGGRDRDP